MPTPTPTHLIPRSPLAIELAQLGDRAMTAARGLASLLPHASSLLGGSASANALCMLMLNACSCCINAVPHVAARSMRVPSPSPPRAGVLRLTQLVQPTCESTCTLVQACTREQLSRRCGAVAGQSRLRYPLEVPRQPCLVSLCVSLCLSVCHVRYVTCVRTPMSRHTETQPAPSEYCS